jgi:hypothetical protein
MFLFIEGTCSHQDDNSENLMDDLQAITSSLLERPTEPVSIPKGNGIIFDIPKEYLVMVHAFLWRRT